MKSPYTFFAEARLARASLSALGAADAADLREYPGKRGERAHRRLHREIGKLLKGRLSKTGAELAVGMNEAKEDDAARTARRDAEGVAFRKWDREVAMLSGAARRNRKPADVRKCAHAVATREALSSGSSLLDPYHQGHEYWQAVLEYAYFTDMLSALARGGGYTRPFPSGRKLPSQLVFPVPRGTPIRTREPLIPKLNQFDKSVAADIQDTDLDTEHFDPMAL